MDTMSILFPRIHNEGKPFILAFAGVTLVLFLIWPPLGWAGLVLTIWCVYFFRDPDRYTPTDRELVICPADGVICAVGKAAPPPELEMDGDE